MCADILPGSIAIDTPRFRENVAVTTASPLRTGRCRDRCRTRRPRPRRHHRHRVAWCPLRRRPGLGPLPGRVRRARAAPRSQPPDRQALPRGRCCAGRSDHVLHGARRPDDRHPRQRRDRSSVSCVRCSPVRRSGASCSPSRAPDPTSPGSPPRRSGTATSGSSTARRSGTRSLTWPTGACSSPAATPTSPSTRA